MTASPAPDAEALSCAIAGLYAGRWARSVARPPAQEGDADAPSPWFIDGFAGADLQRAALRGATAKPAALAAVRALDEVIGRARIVLVEEDPGLLARLADELSGMDAGDRIRISSDPASTEPGEIVLVEAAFAGHAQRLADAIGDAPALVRLAPLAARGLPWSALQPLAAVPSADVLLRFPGEDFDKQARFTGPLADLPPHLRRVVEGCSTLLNDARHGWLLAWREAQRTAGPDAAMAAMLERMQALLASAADERFTHALRVEGKAEAVHLLLATSHPGHALELNGALVDGGAKQKQPPKRKAARPATPSAETAAAAASSDAAVPAADEPPPARAEPAVHEQAPEPEPTPAAAVLDLFLAPEPGPEPAGPDLAAFGDELHARHAGARVPVRELLAGVADSGLTPEQVRAALAALKRAGRAAYRSLDAEGAEIGFLAEPRAAAPRARKARKPAPGELGLFDEPEG